MNVDGIVTKFIINHPYYSDKPAYLSGKRLEDYPILTKKDVIENSELFTPCGSNTYVTYTSGSTGMPMKIVWDRSDYLRSMACLWRLRKEHGIDTKTFYLSCHNSFELNGKISTEPIMVRKNFVSFSKIYFTQELMEKYIKYIELTQPKWIYAQPSFVYHLGLFLKEMAPHLLMSFQYIELVGEMVTPQIKDSIQKMFANAEVTTMYGMQEFNCIMYERDHLLQPCSENVYIEILDSKGEACKNGEEGNIVITGLKNSRMPLIRYKTEDKGRRITDGDTVGYIITQGRANDSFVYDGKTLDGSLFFHIVLKYNMENEKKISKFQVIQKDNALFFNLFGIEGLSESSKIEDKIGQILLHDFKIDFAVKVNIISDITLFQSSRGKTKYFINLNHLGKGEMNAEFV